MMKRRDRVGALLACALSKCGAQMKIIAFIQDLFACVHAQAERDEVIRILRHLKM